MQYKLLLVFSVLSAIGSFCASTKDAGTQAARKDYPIYSPPDYYNSKKTQTPKNEGPPKREDGEETPKDETTDYNEFIPLGFYNAQRPARYYSPEDFKDATYKSGTSVNWNVWKGDPMDMGPPDASGGDGMKGGAPPPPPPPDFNEYYFPMGAWKGDPWTPDQMAAMMTMMNQMQPGKSKGGFLSKLTKEPLVLLMMAILPFTILLAAVLPSLVNMMMNGGLPTVTTTATGNKGRNLNGVEFLAPVVEAISTFGAKTFENPDCMQRIFCQVTKGPSSNATESRSFQKALYKVSSFVGDDWLDSFGVKALFESMEDGDCEKIPCSVGSSTPSASEKTGTKRA